MRCLEYLEFPKFNVNCISLFLLVCYFPCAHDFGLYECFYIQFEVHVKIVIVRLYIHECGIYVLSALTR